MKMLGGNGSLIESSTLDGGTASSSPLKVGPYTITNPRYVKNSTTPPNEATDSLLDDYRRPHCIAPPLGTCPASFTTRAAEVLLAARSSGQKLS